MSTINTNVLKPLNSVELAALTGYPHKVTMQRLRKELGTEALANQPTVMVMALPNAQRKSKAIQLSYSQTAYMLALTNEHRRTVLKQVLGL